MRQSDAQEQSYIVTQTHCMYIAEFCACLPSENTEMYFYKLQRHVCTREVARCIYFWFLPVQQTTSTQTFFFSNFLKTDN